MLPGLCCCARPRPRSGVAPAPSPPPLAPDLVADLPDHTRDSSALTATCEDAAEGNNEIKKISSESLIFGETTIVDIPVDEVDEAPPAPQSPSIHVEDYSEKSIKGVDSQDETSLKDNNSLQNKDEFGSQKSLSYGRGQSPFSRPQSRLSSPSPVSTKSRSVSASPVKSGQRSPEPTSDVYNQKPFVCERDVRSALTECIVPAKHEDWEVIVNALMEAERLASDEGARAPATSWRAVVRSTATHVRSLRSRVSRTACSAMGSLFEHRGHSLDPELEDAVMALLERCADVNRFLRADAAAALVRVLSAVMFMAAGSYQRGVGQDHNLCLAQTTMSKYLGKVVAAINQELKPRWVVFPGTEAARQQVASGFLQKFALPEILGAVDCTHVSIFPPRRPEGLQYINRKGTHSINVQLVADADWRILNVNAQFPGRVHDAFIFRQSVVNGEMRRLHQHRIGQFFLLGDSAYALEPWLMTPVLRAAPHSPEDRYTRWHCRTRNVVERTNGYLKGSLRCLGIDRSLHYTPEKTCSLIYACCTIYNIMQYYGVELSTAEDGSNEYEERPAFMATGEMRSALERRNQLIEQYFN